LISIGIFHAIGGEMRVKSFHDLEAWKQSMVLVERCYKASRQFPIEERYGLTSQLRRAAVSIPSNVAEGHCRRTTRAYANHVSIACGSEGELETCIELALRLGFLSNTEAAQLMERCTEVGKILAGLYSSLEVRLTVGCQARGDRRHRETRTADP
jgi:four helix bundle protein